MLPSIIRGWQELWHVTQAGTQLAAYHHHHHHHQTSLITVEWVWPAEAMRWIETHPEFSTRLIWCKSDCNYLVRVSSQNGSLLIASSNATLRASWRWDTVTKPNKTREEFCLRLFSLKSRVISNLLHACVHILVFGVHWNKFNGLWFSPEHNVQNWNISDNGAFQCYSKKKTLCDR